MEKKKYNLCLEVLKRFQKAIKQIFNKMNKKWQKTVLNNLESIEEFKVIDILKLKY